MPNWINKFKSPRFSNRIGTLAAVMAVMMYSSYVQQIYNNLHGHKGALALPVLTTINCTFWALYGLSLKPINRPILLCNLPGIVLGLVCTVTTF